MISLRPCLTPYDWLLYRTLNIPIDELTWETCFHSDIFRLTDMLVSRVVYTVRHETDIKIDERQMMTHRDICIALTSWTICSCHVWCIPYVTWLIYVWPLLCLDDDFSLFLFFPFVRGEVLPATFSPTHLIVFSTLLCLLSSSSSLPPLLSSSHLLSPLVSPLASLVSTCPPHVTLPHSSAVCHPPSFLRVLPTVVFSSPDSLSSSSALPFLPLTPPFFSTFRMTEAWMLYYRGNDSFGDMLHTT